MKPTRTMTIIACVLAAGWALAQSPSVVQNTRNTMTAVSDKATAASNQALGAKQAATPIANAMHSTGKTVAPVVAPGKASAPSSAPATKAVTKTTSKGKPVHATGTPFLVQPKAVATTQSNPPVTAVLAPAAPAASAENASEPEQSMGPDSKVSANGRRDPFISPVVSHAGGSGCSTGKKCLEIGTISLRGVVHADTGFIAVVSNGLNKAYFLRENDPVFNGYVMKITGDSIVFQETLQDRLGKSFTREVVKKITAPAV